MLAKEGSFYISYLNNGGQVKIQNLPKGLTYKWYNPKNGIFEKEGITEEDILLESPSKDPWVLIIGS
jgi:hypothetical protein